MKEKTAWDRLREQCVPDGKGRFKTLDAIKIAIQIDEERLKLKSEIRKLRKQIADYKSQLQSATSVTWSSKPISK